MSETPEDRALRMAREAAERLRLDRDYIHDLGLRFFDSAGPDCLEATCMACGALYRNNICIDFIKWLDLHVGGKMCGGRAAPGVVLRNVE